MSKLLLALLPVCLSVAACTGHVVSTPIAPESLSATGSTIDGIVVYRPMQVVQVDQLTQFSSDGKVFTTSCTIDFIRKIVSIPNQQHPLVLQYRAGLLETHQFGVNINSDGVLTGVDSQGTPDQGKTLSNLADAALSASKVAAAAAVVPTRPPASVVQPRCNSTPSFLRYDPVPPVSAMGS